MMHDIDHAPRETAMTREQELSTKVDRGMERSYTKPDSAHFNSTQLVSHIPPSTMLAEVPESTATSSESSLESRTLHPFESLTRRSDDETFEVTAPSSLFALRKDSKSVESPSESAHPRGIVGKRATKRPRSGHHHDEDDDSYSPATTKRGEMIANAEQVANLARAPTKTALLAHPDDHTVLSPIHSFIRQQIEVFEATEVEVQQPAPGRKNPIQLHQVGLRCIHCRDAPLRERVKRAVCYPSGVARVYHSVSDMKFDHFNHCKRLPADVKVRLDELKDEKETKRRDKKAKGSGSSASTAQYYHDMALKMGMVDSQLGVFMNDILQADFGSSAVSTGRQPELPSVPASLYNPDLNFTSGRPFDNETAQTLAQKLDPATLAPLLFTMMTTNAHLFSGLAPWQPAPLPPKQRKDAILLSTPSDPKYLNSLHCFVRRHVEVFEATEHDATLPAPGRKTRINIGQVGVRCIHCTSFPVKHRVKRAVCYPPSVNGIYHAVSNMKFDHFAKCRGLPMRDRAEFLALRHTVGRKSVVTVPKACGSSNSTALFYSESARKLGLVDTEDGIRLARRVAVAAPEKVVDPEPREEPVGISALMLAATDPSVRAAYAKTKKAALQVLDFESKCI